MAGHRIADPVHGTIRLDDAEAAVIGTRAFQRLRGVKHLGLAAAKFPAADYSRFAHAVGTMHVTKLILDNLATNVPGCVTEQDVRLYSMAALLHDVGHYPFSHTFERALRSWDAKRSARELAEGTTATRREAILLHEAMGRQVILEDKEIAAALSDAGLDAFEICNIIERTHPPKFSNLVSSDLDADRTDCLMRTARHTGLPYGNVDLPYLLSQIRLDNEQRICFTLKGMRAVEHMLIGRYYDYQQISYHRTVAALELVLNEAVGVLLDSGRLHCDSADLSRMVTDGSWGDFDDAHVTVQLREALDDPSLSDADQLKIRSTLNRWPAKLVAERERLGSTVGDEETFQALETIAFSKQPEWEQQFGAQFYVWAQSGMSLTKIGASLPVSLLEENLDGDVDKLQQAVRIQTSDGSSRVIQECQSSLISRIADTALYTLRIYVLLAPEDAHHRDAIAVQVNDDLGPLWAEP